MRGMFAMDSQATYRGRLAMGVRERRDERFAKHQVGGGLGARGMFLTDQTDRWGVHHDTVQVAPRKGLRLGATPGGS